MKRSTILILHVSFWSLLSLLFYGILGVMLPRADPETLTRVAFMICKVIIGSVVIFYISYFGATFFIKHKNRLYILVISIIVLAVIYGLRAKYVNNNSEYLLDTIGVFAPPLILIFIAFVFRTITELGKNRLTETQLEKERLYNQLELLKAKLNPHFLFNSLNNIDVLIAENPSKASIYLSQLSDILRYVLYETKEDTISLKRELEQIINYVELQKIRTENLNFIDLTIKGDAMNQTISPMIFIPFIENAFKHSKNKSLDNAIKIEFDINPGYVRMVCKNYYDSTHTDILNNDGLGLEVMKKRLNLLYPQSYNLQIDKSQSWFTVFLTIELKNEN